MKKMTTSRAQNESVTDQPIQGKKFTLYPGTIGHRLWLTERKNASFTGGDVTLDSVAELCFAYTTDPEKLQSLKGVKASEAVNKFKINLTDEEFGRIQDHVLGILSKTKLTATSPKKKPGARVPLKQKPSRAPRR